MRCGCVAAGALSTPFGARVAPNKNALRALGSGVGPDAAVAGTVVDGAVVTGGIVPVGAAVVIAVKVVVTAAVVVLIGAAVCGVEAGELSGDSGSGDGPGAVIAGDRSGEGPMADGSAAVVVVAAAVVVGTAAGYRDRASRGLVAATARVGALVQGDRPSRRISVAAAAATSIDAFLRSIGMCCMGTKERVFRAAANGSWECPLFNASNYDPVSRSIAPRGKQAFHAADYRGAAALLTVLPRRCRRLLGRPSLPALHGAGQSGTRAKRLPR